MKFAVSTLLGVGLLLSPIAEVKVFSQVINYKYKPPADGQRREQRTQTGGSRGCPQAQRATLQILAPSTHVARTASSHPTFVFYLSGSPNKPVRVSVTEPGVPQPIFDRRFTVKRAGWFAVSLPADRPGLEKETTYQLTFGLLCNPNKPSESAYRRIAVEKVKLPVPTERQLVQAQTSLEKVKLLAEAGIWYDSVAASYRAALSPNLQAHADFESLLQQVEFTALENGN